MLGPFFWNVWVVLMARGIGVWLEQGASARPGLMVNAHVGLVCHGVALDVGKSVLAPDVLAWCVRCSLAQQ